MPRVPEGDYDGSREWMENQMIPKPFETNKLRYWLKAVGQGQGMIAEHGKYATFYDGLALNIPNYYGIWIQGTDEYLRRYPSELWKVVVIWRTEPNYQEAMVMRNNDILQDFLDGIPLIGNFMADIVDLKNDVRWNEIVKASITQFPIWENLLYKHTVANNVLTVNYAKAINEILPLIRKKYG